MAKRPLWVIEFRFPSGKIKWYSAATGKDSLTMDEGAATRFISKKIAEQFLDRLRLLTPKLQTFNGVFIVERTLM